MYVQELNTVAPPSDHYCTVVIWLQMKSPVQAVLISEIFWLNFLKVYSIFVRKEVKTSIIHLYSFHFRANIVFFLPRLDIVLNSTRFSECNEYTNFCVEGASLESGQH